MTSHDPEMEFCTNERVERGLRAVLDELAGTTGTCWRFNRYVWPDDIPKLVEIFQKAAE